MPSALRPPPLPSVAAVAEWLKTLEVTAALPVQYEAAPLFTEKQYANEDDAICRFPVTETQPPCRAERVQ